MSNPIDKPIPGIGNVVIEFEGKEQNLVPTVRALNGINKATGGFALAFEKIKDMDSNTMCLILGFGLGLTEKGAENLEMRVAQHGLLQLITPLQEYCVKLASGGRPPSEDNEKSEGDSPNE